MRDFSALSPLCEMYSWSKPYEVLSARNATLRLRDAAGKEQPFTDMMCGYGAVNFGHMNPAIDPYADLTSDLVACFFPPSALTHALWLLNQLGLESHTVLYQVGGSFAVTSAIAMAQRIRPGKICTVDGSFHGLGVDTLSASAHGRGVSLQESAFVTRMDESVIRLQAGAEFSAWEGVSCLLYEPIQGATGYLPLPIPWLRELTRAAQAAGVIVIADEIQCGFYRFGHLSIATTENIFPDIYLFSKSMTNGIYPVSAVVYPRVFHDLLPHGDYWNHTFQTAALGFEAAMCVARYLDSNNIQEQIAGVHSILSQTVERMKTSPSLGSFYLAGPTLSFESKDGRAGEIARHCEERGVLVFAGGRGTRVRVAPPITIPHDQLTSALAILEEVSIASPAMSMSK